MSKEKFMERRKGLLESVSTQETQIHNVRQQILQLEQQLSQHQGALMMVNTVLNEDYGVDLQKLNAGENTPIEENNIVEFDEESSVIEETPSKEETDVEVENIEL